MFQRRGRTVTADVAPYSITPMRRYPDGGGFGAFVRGIDLRTCELSDGLVARIKADLREWRFLVFKGQGSVDGERQVAISARLGRLQSTFYKHEASPHPDIFRISNDDDVGCTRIGRTGWHADGTALDAPFKYQTMHFHAVCEGGDTYFIPNGELYARQPEQVRRRWERLWMVTRKGNKVHPLVYVHPIRGDLTLLYHCGSPFCAGWAEDDDADDTTARRPRRIVPARAVQEEIARAAEDALDHIGVRMTWEVGDFAISDNIGNAHFPSAGTQDDPAEVGLRVMHSTTIAGEQTPTKPDGRQSFDTGSDPLCAAAQRAAA